MKRTLSQSTSVDTPPIEVVDLEDNRTMAKKRCKYCCNPKCATTDAAPALRPASKFVARYYGSRENLIKDPSRSVCDACFDLAVAHNENMHRALLVGEPLTALEYPPPDEPVFDLDSDEDEASVEIKLPPEAFMPLSAMRLVSGLVERVADECDVKTQTAACTADLDSRLSRLEDTAAGIDQDFADVQKRLSAMWEQVYAPYRPQYEELEAINIDDEKCDVDFDALLGNGVTVGEGNTLTANGDSEIINLDDETDDSYSTIMINSPRTLADFSVFQSSSDDNSVIVIDDEDNGNVHRDASSDPGSLSSCNGTSSTTRTVATVDNVVPESDGPISRLLGSDSPISSSQTVETATVMPASQSDCLESVRIEHVTSLSTAFDQLLPPKPDDTTTKPVPVTQDSPETIPDSPVTIPAPASPVSSKRSRIPPPTKPAVGTPDVVLQTPADPLSTSPDDIVAVEVVASVKQGPPPAELPPVEVAGAARTAQEPPKVGDRVIAMRGDLLVEWFPGEVIKVMATKNKPAPPHPHHPHHPPPRYDYQIRFGLQNRPGFYAKVVTGRQVAFSSPARHRFSVGSRVVAVFHDDDDECERFYAGVVAEPPKSENNFRYLIFFDDGYTQYVVHAKVREVTECSHPVHLDVHEDVRTFIRDYMERYPERPMLKLSLDQVVKTEFNDKWQLATVKALDNSLCQMSFQTVDRVEWMYRGSTRLGPLYDALIDSRRGGNVARRWSMRRDTQQSAPFVQFNNDADDVTIPAVPTVAAPPPSIPMKTAPAAPSTPAKLPPPSAPATGSPTARRAVAKKSTASRSQPSRPVLRSADHPPPPLASAAGYVTFAKYDVTASPKPQPFVAHTCGPRCLKRVPYVVDEMKHVAPLAVPLMLAWRRSLSKIAPKVNLVSYTAPCGRRLRNQDELDTFLRAARSNVGVDMFCFNPFVSCLAEYVDGQCYMRMDDLSRGVENVAVPCVNNHDLDMPPRVKYTTGREPLENVPVNFDPEFLVGCDCTDGCQDKDSCSCWQQTFAGTAFGSSGVIDNTIGYTHKRLMEPVSRGIYECNARCKCSSTCSNRVVQNPLRLKLQVFKTTNRGWGLRTLNDMPHGTFVCVYAGSILLEQQANEPGHIDEYLAELDYIEFAEEMKEGYEEEVKTLFGDEVIEAPNLLSPKTKEDSRSTSRSRTRDKATTPETSRKRNNKGNKTRAPQRFTLKPRTVDLEARQSARTYLDDQVFLMDARLTGNVGRYFNHSCSANVFVQNVFVDSHDIRLPLVAFFALHDIKAGAELTWDYSYKVGSVTGKVLLCKCGADNCRLRLL